MRRALNLHMIKEHKDQKQLTKDSTVEIRKLSQEDIDLFMGTAEESKTEKTDEFECLICEKPKQFVSKEGLKLHIFKFHPKSYGIESENLEEKPENKKFYCEECPEIFAELALLKAHHIKDHLKLEIYKCDECEQRYKNSHQFIRHYKEVHSQTYRIQCDYCEKSYGRKQSLKDHVKLKHLEKMLKCDFCQDSFIDEKSFIRHVKTRNCGDFEVDTYDIG